MPPWEPHQIVTWIGLCAGGFVLGSLPFGYWLCRLLKGVDLRTVGSGNIGATNAFRCAGAAVGSLVLILDVSKGAVPAWVGTVLYGSELGVASGAFAVAGHSFSPFLSFRGGKGVATALGMLIGVTPITALAALATFSLVLSAFRMVSLASIMSALACVVMVTLRREPITVQVLVDLVALLVVVRHRANLARIMRGEEPKFRLRSKDS